MEMFVNSISDLNIPNLENAFVMLLLNATNDNYENLSDILEFVEYPELIVCRPEKSKDIDRKRRKIQQEINQRCKKRPVVSPDSIIVFQIIDGRANFRKKRAINIENSIKYGVVNDIEELINLVSFCVSHSFDVLDNEIKIRINQGKREKSLGIDINPSAPIPVSPKFSWSKEATATFDLVVSK